MNTSNLSKIGWFVAIWLISILALGIVAYVIRLAINP
jgi:preprotein translocase subunit Sss1